jgi:hypothetical protein
MQKLAVPDQNRGIKVYNHAFSQGTYFARQGRFYVR